MSGEGYNPYRDDDGKFASGPGGGGAIKGGGERRTAPTWPGHKEYVASSTNVRDHAARTRFHAHRAEFFAKKAATARTPEDKEKFAKSAETSAKHAKTCAARAQRADPRSVGALRAKEHAIKAKEHATEARSHASSVATPRASAPMATRAAAKVAQTATAHSAALAAIDHAKSQPMATAIHKNTQDPRGILSQQHSMREVRAELKRMSGKDITPEELTHGFAVPDGYTAKIQYLNTDEDDYERPGVQISFHIHDKDGNKVAELTRSFSRMRSGGMAVEHAYFKIDEKHQGSGLSDHVNGSALRNYEKWGVKKVTVGTAWVGRYAWSRMGFKFDQPDDAVRAVARFVDDHPHLASRREAIIAEAKVRSLRSGVHGIAGMELTGDNPNFTPAGPGAAKLKPGLMRFKDTYNGERNHGGSAKKIEHGFHFGQAVLLSDHMYGWKGTLKVDRNDEGYQQAITKTAVAKKEQR